MNHSAGKIAAMPTALVASLGRGSSSGRARKSRRSGHISLPNPIERLTVSKRRRRRRHQMMKLARNAGAVVSAVTFAAEMASAFRDIKGAGEGGEGPSADRGSHRGSAEVPNPPSRKKSQGKTAATSSANGSPARRGTASANGSPARRGTASRTGSSASRNGSAASPKSASPRNGSPRRSAAAGAGSGSGNGSGSRS